jgi:hypothetical protein
LDSLLAVCPPPNAVVYRQEMLDVSLEKLFCDLLLVICAGVDCVPVRV